ncbi:uncharacterized protein BO80DRAFT_426725 [Aspergillus ibericus CBS 121593]|uniref:Uncharacterized protein n=1 Tax=Aspergillus ibericus CBS 121593 TaxID=1448316 RepID=A0A395GVZ4_9EURO|nr:hypothetical protein BO80DRAFT_426725 [Aspergillus ibericus CBS 121593]RAK99188.1 hypothetical protein BO80DRAFT_426725 [Aspergillus ibericus CBS 121593]
MLFGKTLVTLLASVAIASAVAIPAPIDNTPNALVERTTKSKTKTTTTTTNPFAKIKASKATWEKAAKLCKSGASKRSDWEEWDDDSTVHLFDTRTTSWPPKTPSGFTEVRMDQEVGERDPLGLWTYGLVTCMGVGVTGTQTDSKKNSRFLMHLMASPSTMEKQWGNFQKLVTESGVTNMEGWMSIPDTSKDVPSNWNEDDKELSDDVAEAIEGILTQLIGKAPKIVKRPMAPAIAHELPHGTMQIDKNNEVEIEGTKVTQ